MDSSNGLEVQVLSVSWFFSLDFYAKLCNHIFPPVWELYPWKRIVKMVLDDGRAGVDQLRVGDYAKLFDLKSSIFSFVKFFMLIPFQLHLK